MQLEMLDRWSASQQGLDPFAVRVMFDEALAAPFKGEPIDVEKAELMAALRTPGAR